MNTTELIELLRAKNIPENAYSIGSDSDESYCLIQDPAGWHTYYSERGNRNVERVFESEDLAGQDLLQRLLNDETVQAEIERREYEG